MSLLAHALLIIALSLGLHWRAEEPAGVEAELWAEVPQSAAPPPAADAEPAPEPAPAVAATPPAVATPPVDSAAEREAEIATEQAEKERREAEDRKARAQRLQAEQDRQDQADKIKLERAKEQARQQAEAAERQRLDKLAAQQQRDKQAKLDKAEAAKLDKIRQDQIRRMNAQLGGEGAPGSTGTAARDAGPSAGYAGRIKARIKPNIVLTDPVSGNPSAEVEVRVAADGSIIGRRLAKSSGSREWDEAVLRAIDRTGILPRDTDGRVPPVMLIAFKPGE